MKISIITATYNSAATISSCIASVNEQTYPDIEHIIIDGASKDNTLEIIKSMPNRVSKIVSEPDGGIYDAMNKGINFTTGEIMGILHSDDLFYSDETLKYISSAFSVSNADVVYGDLIIVEKNNTGKIRRYWKSKSFKPNLLNRGWMPAHPTVFMRKGVYKKHGLFNLNMKISADYDFMLRVFSDPNLKFFYLPEVITKMREGGASNGSLKKMILKTKEDYIALKKNSVPDPIWALMNKKITKFVQYI